MSKLAPSILSADLLHLEEQIHIAEKNGADLIHVDVMDGHFVPNITFGPVIVKTLKRITNLPLDVHLMIEKPERMIKKFAEAGADIITIHQEACIHLDRTISEIKKNGCQAGVSLNPSTPVGTLEHVLKQLDLVLIMSVNPGFGGQSFIEYALDKIKKLSILKKEYGYSYQIEVDGGVNIKTAGKIAQAGADILVAGNAIFNQKDIAKACRDLKKTFLQTARIV